MIPPIGDGPGRICWLASAIAGGWRWETPKQRETAAITLGLSYLSFASRRKEMPPLDMAVADAMPELIDCIARTLPARANKRICKKLGIEYHPHYHQPEANF